MGGLLKTSIETNVEIEIISPKWIMTSYNEKNKQLYVCASVSSNKDYKEGFVICKEKNGLLADTILIKQDGFATYEREQLIALYKATNGDKWINNTNWCSEKPINEWYGIKTNTQGAISEINLYSNNLAGIFNFKGIGFLNKINCKGNPKLTSINVDITFTRTFTYSDGNLFSSSFQNTYLSEIDCSNCNISSIKIPDVRSLDFSKNVLSSIDLSTLPSLEYLVCSDNSLASLNLGKQTNLYSVSCSKNRLSSIDISNCPNVQVLFCDNNILTSIKIGSGNNVIYDINCSYNKLGNTALNDLYYSLPRKSGGLRISKNNGIGTQSIATEKGWKFW